MTDWQGAIVREAEKLVVRWETYARRLAEEASRRKRRTTGQPPRLVAHRPSYWSVDRGFDPYLVRSSADRIAHSIQRAIRGRNYCPRNPLLYSVPKADGSSRNVSVFQVADSAISGIVFRSLNEKNASRLSSRAYAYRPHVSAQDAIQFVTSDMRTTGRFFVAEYDFSKYFENISHEYLWKQIRDREISMTDAERSVISAFLTAPAVAEQGYRPVGGGLRQRGVPQGTSASLFLANVAACELDRALERLGVSFVRYADDTLIWSTDYEQICRASDAMFDISSRLGVPINLKKSQGIRILGPDGHPAEMAHTNSVEFLGHRIGLHRTSIRDSVVARFKTRINKLIYFNLLREPLRGTQSLARLGSVDRDYVTFTWQVRRYIYGDISERSLRKFEKRGVPRRRFRGFMAYFPLVDDDEQLRSLDRWMGCQIRLALRKRGRLLTKGSTNQLPPPHGLPTNLAEYTRKSRSTGGTLDLRLPSMLRVGLVIRTAAKRYGSAVVGRSPKYSYGSPER